MNWHEKILTADLERHLELNPDGTVLCVVTEAAQARYGALLEERFANEPRARFVPESAFGPGDLEPRPAVVTLIAGGIPDSRRAYAHLSAPKQAELPVVFLTPERRHFDRRPGSGNAGVTYEGMFWLASAYAQTIRPRRGAYCEFGVFDGRTISMAYHALQDVCGQFYAFDSYSGISGTTDDETSHFADGEYYANLATLHYNLRFDQIDADRVRAMPGRFEDTLDGRTATDDGIEQISVLHVDTDVYWPALLALRYATPALPQGALLLFDDYDQLAASNTVGERKALATWLAENPRFHVEPYRAYGVFGRSFLLHVSDPD